MNAPTEVASSPHTRPPSPRRSLVPLAGVLAGAVVVLAGAALARPTHLDGGAPAAAARQAAETLSRAAYASVEAKESPGSAAAPKHAAPAVRPPAAVPAPVPTTPAVDCAPPYYFDPSGIKHVKAGCG